MSIIHDSNIQRTKKELQANKKLKPKLRKFVIDRQVNRAAEVTKEKKQEREKLLSDTDIIKRCSELSFIAMVRDKLWEKVSSPIEMTWTTGKTIDGKFETSIKQQQDMQIDITGFAIYLLGEYHRMDKDIKALKYPNPLHEDSLKFFWNKFVMDLRLLIRADMARIRAGNKGAILY